MGRAQSPRAYECENSSADRTYLDTSRSGLSVFEGQNRNRDRPHLSATVIPCYLSDMKCCLWSVLLLAQVQLRAQLAASYQDKAQAALQSQVSQIGSDCPNAKTTVEANACMLAAGRKTKSDFETFYASLRSLLSQNAEAVGQLDGSQQQWELYAQKACEAIDSFSRGGTIRFSAVEKCRIQLTRSRMQDLNALYNTVLHL
jgi:uncharacterized protein YecT (DUF1311 family)